MRDLLYLYCGGGPQPVLELLVCLRSLLISNPARTFEIGVALDESAASLLRIGGAGECDGVQFRILPHSTTPASHNLHVHHVVNRWRGLQLFEADRRLVLDIDTIVNRPLDPLFADFSSDVETFTTFSGFSNRDRHWTRHRRFYDATGEKYEFAPLYCTVGLHGVHRDWPFVENMVRYCQTMADYKRSHRIRRAFIEEYSVNLVLLQNGKRVHCPFRAIRKASRIETTPQKQWPHVWHFILGRTHSNPFWRARLEAATEADFFHAKEVWIASRSPIA